MTLVGRRFVLGASALLLYVAVFSVLVASSEIPFHVLLLDLMSVANASVASFLCLLASRAARDDFVRVYWRLLALASLFSALAEAVWAVYELILGVETPYPSIADVAWLLYYPLAFAALMRLLGARDDRRVSGSISSLDAILVSMAGAGLSWEFLISPVIDPAAPWLANATSVAYPVADLLLLGAIVSMALTAVRRSLPRGTIWVVASFVTMLFADAVYTRMTISGTYATGSWVDPLWQLSYALFSIGALVYLDARRQGVTVPRLPSRFATSVRLGVMGFVARNCPYLAVAVAVFLSAYHFLGHDGADPVHDTVVVTIASVIPILVLVRQHLVSLENRLLHRSLEKASEDLERKVVERTEELAAEKERLGVLNEAAREFGRCASAHEVLSVGVRLLGRAKHCAAVAAAAPGPAGTFTFTSADDLSDGGRRWLRGTLTDFILSSAESCDDSPIFLEHPHGRSTARCAHPGEQFRQIMIFPLVARRRLLGVACLASDDPECALSVEESELIASLVSHLALTLEGALRYDDVRFLADFDMLTGLPSRRNVAERLEEGLAESARTGSPYSIALMDIDRFKQINDVYGHASGDRVLSAVAHTLHEAIRGGDIVGRMGGDEFLALLPATDPAGATHLVRRIAEHLAGTSVAINDGVDLTPRLSCGIATYPSDGVTSEALLKVADVRMYESKRRHTEEVALLEEAD